MPRSRSKQPVSHWMKSAERNFGVAIGMEPVAKRFEFAAQLTEIVDLAVVDDDGLVAVAFEPGPHRLFAAIEIDHLQPNRTERDAGGGVNTLLIRPAMHDRRGHPPNQRFVGIASAACEPRDPAHALSRSGRSIRRRHRRQTLLQPLPRGSAPVAGAARRIGSTPASTIIAEKLEESGNWVRRR